MPARSASSSLILRHALTLSLSMHGYRHCQRSTLERRAAVLIGAPALLFVACDKHVGQMSHVRAPPRRVEWSSDRAGDITPLLKDRPGSPPGAGVPIKTPAPSSRWRNRPGFTAFNGVRARDLNGFWRDAKAFLKEVEIDHAGPHLHPYPVRGRRNRPRSRSGPWPFLVCAEGGGADENLRQGGGLVPRPGGLGGAYLSGGALLPLQALNLVESSFHISVGLMFVYAGFLHRDAEVVRSVVEDLGV